MKIKAPTKSHKQMMADWQRDPEFKTAYEELDTESNLLREVLLARKRSGLTQAEAAEKMGTKAPAVIVCQKKRNRVPFTRYSVSW